MVCQDEVILEKVAPNPVTCPHERRGIWTQFQLLRPRCSFTQPGRRAPSPAAGLTPLGTPHRATHEFPAQRRLEKQQIYFQDTCACVVAFFPLDVPLYAFFLSLKIPRKSKTTH